MKRSGPAENAPINLGEESKKMKHPYNRNNGALSTPMPGRADIRPGLSVWIVLKNDQKTNKLTQGIVKDILTKSATHPHGIKVRLESGEVGRVTEIQG